MGRFTFDFPDPALAERAGLLDNAWLGNGYDHNPISAERTVEGKRLGLERKDNASATLNVQVATPRGSRTVATSTLRGNAGPYHLMTELARGSVNRLRNTLSAIEQARLVIPSGIESRLSRITAAFGRVAFARSAGEKDLLGMQVVSDAISLSDQLCDHLAEARLNSRIEKDGRLPTLLGCVLKQPLTPDETSHYCESFNCVRIVPDWRTIERAESKFQWSRLDPLVYWAETSGLAICIGPIFDFSYGTFPDWLVSARSDLPTLSAFMADFAGTLVDRYHNSVRSWQLFSGLNSLDVFGLGEDDRLRLAARLLESSREIDPQASWSYGLNQPYGEVLKDPLHSYSPLVFADTLLRNGFEVAAISLELDSSDPHDGLDLLQLLQSFETLISRLEIGLGGMKNQKDSSLELSLLRLAMSCRSVGALYWRCWSAAQSPEAPAHSLLYDTTERRPSELLPVFQALRNRWLKS